MTWTFPQDDRDARIDVLQRMVRDLKWENAQLAARVRIIDLLEEEAAQRQGFTASISHLYPERVDRDDIYSRKAN